MSDDRLVKHLKAVAYEVLTGANPAGDARLLADVHDHPSTIWKFPVELTDMQAVEMPRGARILDVQSHSGFLDSPLQLWALVDPDADKCRRRIAVRGTGHPVDADVRRSTYIATVQQGSLVWHVFDLGESVSRGNA